MPVLPGQGSYKEPSPTPSFVDSFADAYLESYKTLARPFAGFADAAAKGVAMAGDLLNNQEIYNAGAQVSDVITNAPWLEAKHPESPLQKTGDFLASVGSSLVVAAGTGPLAAPILGFSQTPEQYFRGRDAGVGKDVAATASIASGIGQTVLESALGVIPFLRETNKFGLSKVKNIKPGVMNVSYVGKPLLGQLGKLSLQEGAEELFQQGWSNAMEIAGGWKPLSEWHDGLVQNALGGAAAGLFLLPVMQANNTQWYQLNTKEKTVVPVSNEKVDEIIPSKMKQSLGPDVARAMTAQVIKREVWDSGKFQEAVQNKADVELTKAAPLKFSQSGMYRDPKGVLQTTHEEVSIPTYETNDLVEADRLFGVIDVRPDPKLKSASIRLQNLPADQQMAIVHIAKNMAPKGNLASLRQIPQFKNVIKDIINNSNTAYYLGGQADPDSTVSFRGGNVKLSDLTKMADPENIKFRSLGSRLLTEGLTSSELYAKKFLELSRSRAYETVAPRTEFSGMFNEMADWIGKHPDFKAFKEASFEYFPIADIESKATQFLVKHWAEVPADIKKFVIAMDFNIKKMMDFEVSKEDIKKEEKILTSDKDPNLLADEILADMEKKGFFEESLDREQEVGNLLDVSLEEYIKMKADESKQLKNKKPVGFLQPVGTKHTPKNAKEAYANYDKNIEEAKKLPVIHTDLKSDDVVPATLNRLSGVITINYPSVDMAFESYVKGTLQMKKNVPPIPEGLSRSEFHAFVLEHERAHAASHADGTTIDEVICNQLALKAIGRGDLAGGVLSASKKTLNEVKDFALSKSSNERLKNKDVRPVVLTSSVRLNTNDELETQGFSNEVVAAIKSAIKDSGHDIPTEKRRYFDEGVHNKYSPETLVEFQQYQDSKDKDRKTQLTDAQLTDILSYVRYEDYEIDSPQLLQEFIERLDDQDLVKKIGEAVISEGLDYHAGYTAKPSYLAGMPDIQTSDVMELIHSEFINYPSFSERIDQWYDSADRDLQVLKDHCDQFDKDNLTKDTFSTVTSIIGKGSLTDSEYDGVKFVSDSDRLFNDTASTIIKLRNEIASLNVDSTLLSKYVIRDISDVSYYEIVTQTQRAIEEGSIGKTAGTETVKVNERKFVKTHKINFLKVREKSGGEFNKKLDALARSLWKKEEEALKPNEELKKKVFSKHGDSKYFNYRFFTQVAADQFYDEASKLYEGALSDARKEIVIQRKEDLKKIQELYLKDVEERIAEAKSLKMSAFVLNDLESKKDFEKVLNIADQTSYYKARDWNKTSTEYYPIEEDVNAPNQEFADHKHDLELHIRAKNNMLLSDKNLASLATRYLEEFPAIVQSAGFKKEVGKTTIDAIVPLVYETSQIFNADVMTATRYKELAWRELVDYCKTSLGDASKAELLDMILGNAAEEIDHKGGTEYNKYIVTRTGAGKKILESKENKAHKRGLIKHYTILSEALGFDPTKEIEQIKKGIRPKLLFFSKLPPKLQRFVIYDKSIYNQIGKEMVDQDLFDDVNLELRRLEGTSHRVASKPKEQRGGFGPSEDIYQSLTGPGARMNSYAEFWQVAVDSKMTPYGFTTTAQHYIKASLDKLQVNRIRKKLVGVSTPEMEEADSLGLGLVGYEEQVSQIIENMTPSDKQLWIDRINEVSKQKIDVLTEQSLLTYLGYTQVQDASSMAVWKFGRFHKPWMHKQVATLIENLYQKQKGDLERNLSKFNSTVKRMVMALPYLFIGQVVSGPVVALAKAGKPDIIMKHILGPLFNPFSSRFLFMGSFKEGKKILQGTDTETSIFDELSKEEEMEFIELVEAGMNAGMGKMMMSSLYDVYYQYSQHSSERNKRDPETWLEKGLYKLDPKHWEDMKLFLETKGGMDKYTFEILCSRIVFESTKAVRDAYLKKGIDRKMANRMASKLMNDFGGTLPNHLYGKENVWLGTLLFAKDFNVTFMRIFTGALYPLWKKWHGYKFKGPGQVANAILHADSTTDEMNILWKDYAGYMGHIFLWSTLLFNLITYGLSFFDDDEEKRGRGLFNLDFFTGKAKSPFYNEPGKELSIRLPIKAENGQALYASTLIGREAPQLLDALGIRSTGVKPIESMFNPLGKYWSSKYSPIVTLFSDLKKGTDFMNRPIVKHEGDAGAIADQMLYVAKTFVPTFMKMGKAYPNSVTGAVAEAFGLPIRAGANIEKGFDMFDVEKMRGLNQKEKIHRANVQEQIYKAKNTNELYALRAKGVITGRQLAEELFQRRRPQTYAKKNMTRDMRREFMNA